MTRARIVCAICGTEAVWVERGGTPAPICPRHPRQEVFRGLRAGEAVELPEPVIEAPQQGELFGGER